MPIQQIKNHRTGRTIYQGNFPTTGHALARAARDAIRLDFADLPRANLINANLDGLLMRDARLPHANLMGANLSEAELDGTDFTGAGLQNTCLAASSLRRCRFDGALFGATDTTDVAFDRSVFSSLSALLLDFRATRSMAGCRFQDVSGISCPLTQPPLAFTGLPYPVFVLDRHLKIGSHIVTHAEFLTGLRTTDPYLQGFLETYGDDLLLPLIRTFAAQENAKDLRRTG